MSLLDDVSIVVTPNGYKAGELYAVIPVPTEGAEEVDNNDFSTASDWTTGSFWTVSGNGLAVCGGTQTGNAYLTSLSGNAIIGRTYTVTIIVDVVNAGWTRIRVGGVDTGLISSADTYTYTIIATGSTDICRIQGNVDFDGTISSVSIKEYTSADMDVTRATAATRVDENGLVNYAEVIGGEEVTNGDFATDGTPSTNTWTLGWYSNTANVSISGGKITLTNSASESDSRAYTTNGVSSNNILITNQLYKLQYEVIANNGVTSFKYYSSSGVFIDAPIDLGVTHTIYIKNTSNQLFLFQNATTNSNISLDNVSVKEVTRDNVPRIDYTGGGCPHILAEPQRTNLVTYSEDFSNADWGNASIGTTPVLTSGFISPDGTNNAYKISNANQDSMWFSATLIGASDSRTIYARTVSGTGTAQLLSHNSNTNNTFNLTEEWQRFEVSATTSGTGSTSYYAVDFRGSGTLTELLIWGAQTEVGSYPTSYIPTNGEAGGVTRNQDIFTRDGIGSLINSTEGVLFVEMAALSNDGTFRNISLNNGTTGQTVRIYYRNQDNKITVLIGSSSGASVTIDVTDTLSFNKIAISYKVNDVRVFVNGSLEGTITSVAMPVGLNELALDVANNLPFYGKVRQLQVYDTALTDEQLEALTL